MTDSFAEKAKTFDNNPVVVDIARKFFDEMNRTLEINNSLRILDFGCGTGLVGLQFAPLVDSIVMVDKSKAMLSVLQDRIKSAALANIEIMEGEISDLPIENLSIDLIVSSMAFHHIEDISGLLKTLYGLLKKNGYIVISDIFAEDGAFHGPEVAPHSGFNPDEIRKIFTDSNLSVKDLYKINVINKPDKDGILRCYDQFILIAQKQ